MPIQRRRVLALSPLCTIALATPASAQPIALTLTCDAAAAPAIARAAATFTARTGARIRIHPTAPGLVLPQLEHEIQNDILVTTPATLDQAERESLVAPGGRTGPWRNRLVVAAARDPAGPANSFAAPDPSPGSDLDGPAIIQRLGLPQTTAALGTIDTDAVAWLLLHGAARQGLLHQTEVTADDRLHATAAVPDDAWPPILYAATVTRMASRPNPAAFVEFLGTPDGQAALTAAGLEVVK